MIQWMLAIWSLVPLPFLNPAEHLEVTSHILLKPDLENFECYFANMWDECDCAVVRIFFGIAFLWDWNENWTFLVLWPLLSFQICWHIECSTFTASSVRIWNSSTEIPSPPLTLFILMFPKAHLTSHSRMFGSRWEITPSWCTDGHNKGQKWYGSNRSRTYKKRWQEYTELYKKNLHDPDNHDGVITHLEPIYHCWLCAQ